MNSSEGVWNRSRYRISPSGRIASAAIKASAYRRATVRVRRTEISMAVMEHSHPFNRAPHWNMVPRIRPVTPRVRRCGSRRAGRCAARRLDRSQLDAVLLAGAAHRLPIALAGEQAERGVGVDRVVRLTPAPDDLARPRPTERLEIGR